MMTLDQLEAVYEASLPRLESLPRNKIVLYGAGNKGREILRALRTGGHTVDAFIDQSRREAVDGVPVFEPADPQVTDFARDGYTAVVGVFNYAVDPLAIHSLLDSKGFSRVVGIAELRQHFPLGETYWLGESERMTPLASIARNIWLRLKDSESRTTLANAVALRRTLDPRYLRNLSAFDQYAPASVPTPRKRLRFVDGGAYDGDTLADLAKVGCEFEAVAAFEPDPENYSRLAANVSARDLGTELTLFPCGLGSRTEQVRFRSQGLSSSSISQDGDAIIQIVALDECAPRFCPNYVKLDIEGAEAAALRGMAKTIRLSRPALAVCVYHKPADLWEIPMLVEDLLPDSDFYLRAHAWNGFELVLYAVPHEMTRA
jgi:FkbM family methyltransferase